MIVQFQQLDDKYRATLDNKYIGDIEFFWKKEGRDVVFFVSQTYYHDSVAVEKVAKAAITTFNCKNVIVKNKYSKRVVDKDDSDNDIFVLKHLQIHKPNESTLYAKLDKLGTVFKNRKNLILDTLYSDKDFGGKYTENLANASHQLARLYNQNVTILMDGEKYVITPQTWIMDIKQMFRDTHHNCYHNYTIVGTYKYTGNTVEFRRANGVTFRNAFDGAAKLISLTDRNVKFVTNGKTESVLFKLYKRELKRKK